MEIKENPVSEENRRLFEQIQHGNSDAILQGLSHPGAIFRVNGAISAVKYVVKTPVIKMRLERIKNDNTIINGYRVSDFAIAALDILGLEMYRGNDLKVRALIKSKLIFE